MCNSIEMKYSEGVKTLEFKLEGFNEERSLLIAKDIMAMVTNSGQPKAIKRLKLKRINLNSEKLDSNLVEEETTTSNIVDFHNKIEIPHKDIPIEEPVTDFNKDTETFQTYYICKCGDRGKHFIPRSRIHINCKKCGKRMQVRDANMYGFPHKDDYGNTYIAGEFRRSDELKYGAAFY